MENVMWWQVMCRVCPASAVVAVNVTVVAAAADSEDPLVAMSGLSVGKVIWERCTGEVRRVVQVTVCCAVEMML